MSIVIRRPWTRQPPVPVLLARGGPVTTPSFLYSPIAGNHRDWTRSLQSTGTTSSTPSTDGIVSVGSISAGAYPTFSDPSFLNGKNEISVLLRCRFDYDATATGQVNLVGAWSNKFLICSRFGAIRAYISGATGSPVTSGGILSASTTKFQTILWVVKADGSIELSVDGVLYSAGGSYTSPTIGSGASSLTIGDGSYTFSTSICVIWPKALSRPEQVSAANNPWQFFAPQTSRIWVPSAASGVPTLSASTYVTGSLTSTGWRPQVTAS